EDANQREPQHDLVGDHLGGGAEPTEQGVAVRGGPGSEDDAVHAGGADREDEQGADVEIGDVEVDVAAEELDGAAEGDHRRRQQRGHEDDHRREPEDDLVGTGRDQIFLAEQLHGVSERLPQAMPARAGRTEAILERGKDLALEPGHIRHADEQHIENDEGHDERDPDRLVHLPQSALEKRHRIPARGRFSPTLFSHSLTVSPLLATVARCGTVQARGQWYRDVGRAADTSRSTYRSPKPSTISMVPISATAPASMAPCAMCGRTCRLTKSGVRIRNRYGIGPPSETM